MTNSTDQHWVVKTADQPQILEIADRAQAIQHALTLLGPGDSLIIAGKGHESVQILGQEHIPFSDQQTAKASMSDPWP